MRIRKKIIFLRKMIPNFHVRLCLCILALSSFSSCDKNGTSTTASTKITFDVNSTAATTTHAEEKDNVFTVHMHDDGDMLCIVNFGDCMNANDTCSDDRAFLKGLCSDSPRRLCCAPMQREMTSWESKDEDCISQFGECMLDTNNCSGTFKDFTCGGPSHRRCCTPDAKDAAEWIKDDKICEQSLGTCQLNLRECKGEYQVGTCGGPQQRQCCLPGNDVKTEWKNHDAKCYENWGTCTAAVKSCSGKRNKSMCGGPDERQCCVPDKATVKAWAKDDDKKCLLEFGSCQHDSANCTGKIEDGKCGGPSYRKCCIPDIKNLEIWKKDDDLCNEKGGQCQSIATPCHEKYQEGFCGGPAKVRQCCIKPVKEGEVLGTEKPDEDKKEAPATPKNTSTESIMKRFSSNLTLLLSVSIPALAIMIIALYCLIKKRGTCCRPYKKLKTHKTPWYKMEYNEIEPFSVDDDEDVNLTASEESKTYA
uniref:uncharacterized protein LOC120344356 isoform X1 n=1 Tax=Styela clava TaxID=7725 RepID=UPI00193A88DA|nr:uncharacterized protein LOC120344356 isoform X1 [Styela clava]